MKALPASDQLTGPGDPQIGTLVLIDDNEVDQLIYRRIARRSGIVGEILSFVYAEDALDYLAKPGRAPVDAILLDVNMPRMSGFEFLEAATERFGEGFARIVVVMLTTSLDPRDMDRAKGFEIVRDYLTKPLDEQDLRRLAAMLDDMGP